MCANVGIPSIWRFLLRNSKHRRYPRFQSGLLTGSRERKVGCLAGKVCSITNGNEFLTIPGGRVNQNTFLQLLTTDVVMRRLISVNRDTTEPANITEGPRQNVHCHVGNPAGMRRICQKVDKRTNNQVSMNANRIDGHPKDQGDATRGAHGSHRGATGEVFISKFGEVRVSQLERLLLRQATMGCK